VPGFDKDREKWKARLSTEKGMLAGEAEPCFSLGAALIKSIGANEGDFRRWEAIPRLCHAAHAGQ